MDNSYDKSITDAFSSQNNMDYSKYLSCLACQESGSYCTKHRSEVESCLRKREVIKILRIHDHQSPRYRHAIKSLLESYDVWKISA